jgi:DNA primase large subunit
LDISYELIKHYPWLPSKNIYYSEITEKDPVEFIKEKIAEYPDGELVDRIFSIFKTAFENSEEIKNYKADELNVSLYTILKILLYLNNSIPIANRVANLYSKHMYHKMIKENNDSDLFSICKDLELDIKYYDKPVPFGLILDKNGKQVLQTRFSIHYIDYLRLASNLRDDYRKLVHNPLVEGYVLIEKKDLIRLLQEVIRKKIVIQQEKDLTSLEAFTKKALQVEEIRELNEKILGEWELKKEEFEFSFEIKYKKGERVEESFPPCVAEILLKIDQGQNITHIERLFLVFFLHSLEIPIDEIVNLFAKLPDFDRKKTEYQVQFAKKKEYSPHSCSTLKSYSLCMAKQYNDELCLEGYFSKKNNSQKMIQHPLFYVQLKQYRKYGPKEEVKPKKKNE